MSPANRRALVLLHGFEDDVGTLEPLRAALLDEGADAARGEPPVVVTPRGPVSTPDGPAWFVDAGDGIDPDQVAQAVATVHAAIVGVGHNHGIAPHLVTLAGFSQGAAVALAAAFHPDAPQPLGGLVLVAPFLLPPDVTPMAFGTAPLAGVHILYGDADETVPAPMSRSVGKLLERRGMPATVLAVEGAGHDLAALLDPAHFEHAALR